jgi:hypothetical protein
VSCSRTFATLRLSNDDLDPDLVTSRLGVVPTLCFRRGDPTAHGGTHRIGGWRLSTEPLSSLDVCDHIDQLLDQIEPVRPALEELRHEGVRQDVFCYWATSSGQGGPEIGVSQMRRLADCGLALSFDIYRT